MDAKDAKRVAKGSQPLAKIKEDLGKKVAYGESANVRPQQVIVNMWKMQALPEMPKIHALVFPFDRCNPKKPDQTIKIKKNDKYCQFVAQFFEK